MDRYRVNRQSGVSPPFFDGPLNNHGRSPENYRGGLSVDEGNPGYHGSFESFPSHSIGRRVDDAVSGFQPMGPGAGFTSNHQIPLTGQKRGLPFPSRNVGFPDCLDGSGFAKLFVGSVPRTSTEEDIRPLFEEHGRVVEVALIRDKRTGQQQGCCFIKFATSEEAERAIRALHNQHILPGGVAPIQVRYADGERERLGTVEYKLFVGSLDRQATERDVEGIFSPYGRVEDVYLMRDEMKASRGCGFVKFSHREMAVAAINALNGIYTMRGCDQPLIVRFADPKKPRAGEPRGAATLGTPGFGSHFQAPGINPIPDTGDTMGDNFPPSGLHSSVSQNVGPSPIGNSRDFGRFPMVSGDGLPSSTMCGTAGLSLPSASTSQLGASNSALAVPSDGTIPRYPVSSTLAPHSFSQPLPQVPSVGQQIISPLQRSLQSPQNFPQNLPLPQRHFPQGQPQTTLTQTSIPSHLPPSHLQFPHPANQVVTPVAPQNHSLNKDKQPQAMSSGKEHLNQSTQHPPSQLAQLISQQTQSLHASFQSSRQAFSELQQQMQMMQPSNQVMMMPQQSSSQAPKVQRTETAPQSGASTPGFDNPSIASVASSVPIISQVVPSGKCNWTEHTSPDGFKYYHNSMSGESTWEKPEELTLFEQRQQKNSVQQTMQSHPHVIMPTQQIPQSQNFQHLQTQFLHSQQRPLMPSMGSGVGVNQNIQEIRSSHQVQGATNSVNEPSRFQQGLPAAAMQEWMWKNNPTA